MPAPAQLHRSDGRTEWVHSGGNYESKGTRSNYEFGWR